MIRLIGFDLLLVVYFGIGSWRLRNRELVSRVMDDLEGRELNEKEKRNLESVEATLKSLE